MSGLRLNMSKADVKAWLLTLGSSDVYNSCADALEKYGVDGDTLIELTDEELKKFVPDRIPRLVITTAITNFKATLTRTNSHRIPKLRKVALHLLPDPEKPVEPNYDDESKLKNEVAALAAEVKILAKQIVEKPTSDTDPIRTQFTMKSEALRKLKSPLAEVRVLNDRKRLEYENAKRNYDEAVATVKKSNASLLLQFDCELQAAKNEYAAELARFQQIPFTSFVPPQMAQSAPPVQPTQPQQPVPVATAFGADVKMDMKHTPATAAAAASAMFTATDGGGSGGASVNTAAAPSPVQRPMSEADRQVAAAMQSLDFTTKQVGQNFEMHHNSADVCIMMDCTGSMAPFIKVTSQKIAEIVVAVKGQCQDVKLRMGFIGYRNFHDEETKTRWDILPFTDDIKKVEQYIGSRPNSGGGDGLCDIHGAFDQLLKLDWKGSAKLLIHIGDMPCHGRQFNSYPPDDAPDELLPAKFSHLTQVRPISQLLPEIAGRRIDYIFTILNAYATDKMMKEFQKIFDAVAKKNHKMQMVELTADATQFTPRIIESMSKTIRAAMGSAVSNPVFDETK